MEQPSGKSSPTTARVADSVCDTSLLQNLATIEYPPAWYYFASVKELSRGPVSKQLIGKSLVGFLTESGQPGILSDRCSHMGSQLAGGCVVGENLQCSLHHWQFGTDGYCSHIPATNNIPSFARQTSYSAVIRYGYVYFFNGPQPDFPLPFFDSLSPDDLVASQPFVETVHCPWYMIGANAVDTQHFSIAHDRTLLQLPEVDYPDPLAHRTVCHFQIAGDSLADRVTKYFGGATVRLQVTDWCSTMVFAHSTLASTETFGMLSIVPLAPDRTLVHGTIRATDQHVSSPSAQQGGRATVRIQLVITGVTMNDRGNVDVAFDRHVIFASRSWRNANARRIREEAIPPPLRESRRHGIHY